MCEIKPTSIITQKKLIVSKLRPLRVPLFVSNLAPSGPIFGDKGYISQLRVYSP